MSLTKAIFHTVIFIIAGFFLWPMLFVFAMFRASDSLFVAVYALFWECMWIFVVLPWLFHLLLKIII